MQDTKRHLFLTLWLSLIILANLFSTVLYFLRPGSLQVSFPQLPLEIIHIMGLIALFNIVFAVALFKWKKWGFWGFCLCVVLSAFINLHYQLVAILPVILIGCFSIGMLYWALSVGKENKAWDKLTY